MTTWVKDLIASPELAKLLKNVSIGMICVIVLGFLGYAGFRMLETNDGMIGSVTEQNKLNAATLQKQTEILSRQTDQLADLKQNGDRTSRTLERMADTQERLQNWLERRSSPVAEATK